MLPAPTLKQSWDCCLFLSQFLHSYPSHCFCTYLYLVFLPLHFSSSFSFFCLSFLSLMLVLFYFTLICPSLALSVCISESLSLAPLPSPTSSHFLSFYLHSRNTDPWCQGPPTQSPHHSFQCQGLTRSSSFSQLFFFCANSPSDEGVAGGSMLPPRPLHCHPRTNGFWAQPWFLLPL